MLQTAVASVVLPVLQQSLSAPAWAADTDYAKVRAAISKVVKSDPDFGPTLVRLAWHSSGTYDRSAKNGGSGPGTMRFKEEQDHGANAGLGKAVARMEPIKKAFPSISYGDLYTLAGIQAIEDMGGPKIGWRSGRLVVDGSPPPVEGRLPAADKGNPMDTAAHLRQVFTTQMGFNDQEIVALSGAHALGRCHLNASGYEGPWTPTPTMFNNAYFVLLKNLKWTPRKWEGPFQYSDASGQLMMLPSDLVLLQDKKFKKWVDVYADSEEKFFADFSKAFQTLLELGVPNLA
ncbi:unnamed protein product [Chrysoparadoxa australica]